MSAELDSDEEGLLELCGLRPEHFNGCEEGLLSPGKPEDASQTASSATLPPPPEQRHVAAASMAARGTQGGGSATAVDVTTDHFTTRHGRGLAAGRRAKESGAAGLQRRRAFASDDGGVEAEATARCEQCVALLLAQCEEMFLRRQNPGRNVPLRPVSGPRPGPSSGPVPAASTGSALQGSKPR